MSFWSNFANIAKIVGPSVLSVIPGVPPIIIPLVVHGITTAESMQGATGDQKKAAAMSLINDGLTGLNAAKGETVLDPAVVVPAVSQGVDAVVTTINAVKAAHAEDAAEVSTH